MFIKLSLLPLIIAIKLSRFFNFKKLAEKMVELIPSAEKVTFVNSRT